MSIDRCTKCECLVDTDFDDGAYGEDGKEECLCAYCRDRLWAEQLRDWKLDDPRRGQGCASRPS